MSSEPAASDRDDSRVSLNRDVITDAALALLDEVGLAKLSTRRLATTLGIQSASLYWHFRNKDELLDAMSARLFNKNIPGPSEQTADFDWGGWLASGARAIRKTALGTRDGAIIMQRHQLSDAGSRARVARNVSVLQHYGFTEAEAYSALHTLRRFAISAAQEEQRIRDVAQTGPGLQGEELFDFGLNLIIESLRRKVEGRTPGLPES